MLRSAQTMFLLVVTLLIFGVVMVTSAGLRVSPEEPVTLQMVLTSKPAILAGLAILAMLIGWWVPVGRLSRARGLANPVIWVVLASMALLLATNLPGIGREAGGANRWINLGPISFQPSELAKWGLPFVLAWHATRRAGAMSRFWTGFVPPIILLLLICSIIGWADLGTAALIFAVGVLLLIAGGAKLWHGALLAPPAAVLFGLAVIVSPYRVNRILAYINPYDDPQGIGYHIIQSMTAITGGGLAGRGLGNSVQKFGYLPEDTTDFIFAIICEELGLAGAVVVIILYAALTLVGLSIVSGLRSSLERLFGLGIILTLSLQAVINIAVVTGVAPTKGIALPLLSAGGTGWVLTAFSLGLLASMAREAERAKLDDPAADGRL